MYFLGRMTELCFSFTWFATQHTQHKLTHKLTVLFKIKHKVNYESWKSNSLTILNCEHDVNQGVILTASKPPGGSAMVRFGGRRW